MFRPMPILTVFAVLGLALLVTLGVWQVQRADWKRAEIAAYEARAGAAPVDLEAAFCAGMAAQGQRVEDPAIARSPSYVRVYGRSPDGAPGWRIFAPVKLPGCAPARHILAEVAFRTLDAGEDYEVSGAPAPDGPFRLSRPPRANAFTPPAKPDTARFYAYEAEAMAEALPETVVDLITDWWLVSGETGLPEALAATPPARHIGYAITWFGLALTLIAVYLAFHVKSGRLAIHARSRRE